MLPMMGHLAAGVQFESLMLKWRREYGPFFEFRLPNNPSVVIVADPEAIKEASTWGDDGREWPECCAVLVAAASSSGCKGM
jgi:hypothetical protein